MKIFLLDLWHDLREKRLWPVALVLVVGLIAVPVVMSTPAATPVVDPVDQPVRKAPDPEDLKALASVKLDESADGRGSSLDTFDPSNPFRPPLVEKDKAEDGAASTVTSDQGESTPAGGESESTGGDAGSGGGDTPTTGGGETPSTGGETPSQTTQYRYVVDLTFMANGRTRRVKGMERLDMLPSEESPLLLYLGVTPDAGSAVFLVDSTLDAVGEGSCKPRASECAFLYLGAGSEHEFTNDEGDSYTLRIDEIRKVKVDDTAVASRRGKARAAVGASAKPRRFAAPMLADLVSVSSGGGDDSSNDQVRR